MTRRTAAAVAESALPDMLDEALDTPPEAALSAAAEGDEAPPDEAAVAAFGQWYESQPAEWIAFMDVLGHKGSVASRP